MSLFRGLIFSQRVSAVVLWGLLVTHGGVAWAAPRDRERLSIRSQKYKALAALDGLTGLCNRRSFSQRLPDAVAQAEARGEALSLLLLDVDNFKSFNDTYGHPAGDAVLRRLADVLRRTTRGRDVAGRYGGEEFVVVLPGTSAEQARFVAENLRKAFRAESFDVSRDEPVHATISIGIAEYVTGQQADDLVARADEALYRAKEAGKDRHAVAKSA